VEFFAAFHCENILNRQMHYTGCGIPVENPNGNFEFPFLATVSNNPLSHISAFKRTLRNRYFREYWCCELEKFW
jgi:hypothetical protein